MRHLGWTYGTVQVYDREYHAQTETFLKLGKRYEDTCRELLIKAHVAFRPDGMDIPSHDWTAPQPNRRGLNVRNPQAATNNAKEQQTNYTTHHT